MFDFVHRRGLYYAISLLVLLPGVISLIIPPSLKPGIEFSGGSTFTVRFAEPVSRDEIDNALADLGHSEARIQGTGDNKYLVRTRELEGAAQEAAVGPSLPSERDAIQSGLQERFGGFLDADGNPSDSFLEFSSVSGTISRGIGRDAAFAVAVAALGILLWMTYKFWSMPRPFLYGSAAIVALMHDALLVVGVFSILGKTAGIEINAMFITGLLTVIGFSVHDTIVVFDRIRENTERQVTGETYPDVVNASLNQTLARSLNTSITVVFVILALLFLGGASVRDFLLVLLVGIISGTYSSIFIASQLLVSWEEGDFTRLLRRRRQEPAAVSAPGG